MIFKKYLFSKIVLILFLITIHHSPFTILNAESISTQRLAFVDIDRIYEKFPMKVLAEKEIKLRKEEYRLKLEAMDKKIRELELKQALEAKASEIELSTQTEVASSTQAVSAVAEKAEISTGTVKALSIPEQISELKIEKKRLSKEAKDSVKNLGGEYSIQVMGRIYDAIKEVADFHGYTVVINKSECLYGIPSTDLTDEVLEKLK